MSRDPTIERLLAEHGRTFADEAGIRLSDAPMPLYRLLVLALLSATRISARLAVAASRELSADGLRTPAAMSRAEWRRIVHTLGRAHYVRYDESTATALRSGAWLLLDRWGGDLRRLRAAAEGDPELIRTLLQEHPRIGPVGADIFCREAQGLWPELRPAFDARALAEARRLRLPGTATPLAAMVTDDELPELAAALVRASLGRGRQIPTSGTDTSMEITLPRGSSPERERVAARTVNKERARHRESKTVSRTSLDDFSSGQRGGLRSHSGAKGPTFDQLYQEAKQRNIHGRSRMNKRQLADALGR